MNLIEELQEEIKRVNEIIQIYKGTPAGNLVSMLMSGSVKNAEQAIEVIDTAGMIKAIKDLQGWNI